MAMEDFRVDVVIGKGPGATAIPLEIPPFTLVGATTRAGLLPGPLRDRFGFTAHLEFYEPDELDRDRAPVRRAARRRRSPTRAPPRSPPAPAAPRGSPTGCCAGSATTPRSAPTASSPSTSPARRSSSTRSTSSASTGSTGPSSTRCAGGSAADRSASPRSRSPSARSARPSRRSPSRSWCAAASWPVRRAAGSPPRPPGSTSGWTRRRRRRAAGDDPLCSRTDSGFARDRGLARHARLHLPVGRPACVCAAAAIPLNAREVLSWQGLVSLLPLVGDRAAVLAPDHPAGQPAPEGTQAGCRQLVERG